MHNYITSVQFAAFISKYTTQKNEWNPLVNTYSLYKVILLILI